MKTAKELIAELNDVPEELSTLPVVVRAENGELFQAKVKYMLQDPTDMRSPIVKIIITHDE